MEIKGKCIQVLPVVTGTKKDGSGEWKKQDFVIETEGQYPKKICLQLFGAQVNNTPAIGDLLTCHFNLESREYNSRWYTNVNCWKLEGFTGNLGQRSRQQRRMTRSITCRRVSRQRNLLECLMMNFHFDP